MTRATKLASIDNQIQKKQEKLIDLKRRCDVIAEEIQELLKQREDIRKEELLNEIESSGRTYEEVLEFLKSAPKRTTSQAKAKRKYTPRKAKSGD